MSKAIVAISKVPTRGGDWLLVGVSVRKTIAKLLK